MYFDNNEQKIDKINLENRLFLIVNVWGSGVATYRLKGLSPPPPEIFWIELAPPPKFSQNG